MTERDGISGPDPNDPEKQTPGPTPPAAPRVKRRRWPWIAAGAIVFFFLFLILLPSLLSTAVGRAIVVSQINSRINGRLEISDWSLGWFTGISVDGIVINDSTNRQIFQLPHFGTKLGLLGAIRGKFNIGQTRIEGLDVLVTREADGSLNWSHMAKGSESPSRGANPTSPQPAGETKPGPANKTALPDVSGELILSGARITYEDATRQAHPVYLRNVQANVKIPGINQPITDSFSAEAQIGSATPGSLSADGTVAAISNNAIETLPRQLDQTIKLTGLDLSAVSSLVGNNDAANLTGRTDGQLAIHLTDGNGTADGGLTMAGVSLGQSLKNESFAVTLKAQASQNLSVVVPELHAAGSLVTADLSNAELNIAGLAAGGSPLQNLKKATLVVKIPSLPKIQAMLRSLSPPKPGRPANLARSPGPAFAAASPKLPGDALPEASALTSPADDSSADLTDGSAEITVEANPVGADLHLQPRIVVSKLAVKKGKDTYALSSINLNSDAMASLSDEAQDIQLSKADIDLNDLVINGVPYAEKRFHLGAAASMQPRWHVVELKNVTASAATTNAFSVSLQGKIADLGAGQRIDKALTLDLKYDAGELFKLVVPLLSADSQARLKDARASGQFEKKFELTGACPSGQPFNQAVQQLVLKGDLQLDAFDGAGVSIQKLDVPIMMNSGFVRIIYPDKPTGQNLPPAAGFNGGTLNLGGCQVDLREPTPTLSTVGNMNLVANAGLNSVFAAWSLGTILDNPLFVGAKDATGYLTVTVVNCDRLPLDSTILTSQDGSATLDLSVRELAVANSVIERLFSVARLDSDSVRGDIPKYRIIIHQGIAEQDLTLTIGQNQRPLRMFGKVRLADRQLMPLTFDIPWKLFGIKGVPHGLDKTLPDGIQIPMTGTLDNPQFSFDFNKLLGDSEAQNAGAIIPGLFGGGNATTAPGSSTQPAENDPIKSIQDLIDQATKKKKKK